MKYIKRITTIAILILLGVGRNVNALTANITHTSGNPRVALPLQSQLIEIEEQNSGYAFAFVGKRDLLQDQRQTTNAALIAYSSKDFDAHRLSLGLGAHLYQQKDAKDKATVPQILPAFGFEWRHPEFLGQVSLSEKMTRVNTAFLVDFFLPIELGSTFEYFPQQASRWTLDAFVSLSRYGGFVAGYEPLANVSRVGLWFDAFDTLQGRVVWRVASADESYAEFSVRYTFVAAESTATKSETTETQKTKEVKEETPRPKKLKTVPAFSTLVKWGLTPVEALKLTREKNICALSGAAQAALQRHRWECRA